jgi:ribonuclease III
MSQDSVLVQNFARQLGYKEGASDLLKEALTHRTFAHESKVPLQDNQRLEFLGDAVIGLSVAHHLMQASSQDNEGRLSHKRAQLINAKTLAQCADDLGVDLILAIGKGEINMGPAARQARLADAFEAIVGALYLDYNFIYASTWVWKVLQPYQTDSIEPHVHVLTPKTRLQQWAHQRQLQSPTYNHQTHVDTPNQFIAIVYINDHECLHGEGSSKKEAEQNAAENTLYALKYKTLVVPSLLNLSDVTHSIKNKKNKKIHKIKRDQNIKNIKGIRNKISKNKNKSKY